MATKRLSFKTPFQKFLFSKPHTYRLPYLPVHLYSETCNFQLWVSISSFINRNYYYSSTDDLQPSTIIVYVYKNKGVMYCIVGFLTGKI